MTQDMQGSQVSLNQSQAMNATLTQSQAIRADLAQKIDELIQVNELLLKENDYMQTFIMECTKNQVEFPTQNQQQEIQKQLSQAQKLSVALFMAQKLNEEKDQMTKKSVESTVKMKAQIVAYEQKLAVLRRLMFQFQREVLNDQQISNQFQPNAEGVEQVVHKMPKQVFAQQLKQYYDRQTNAMQVTQEQFRQTLQKVEKQISDMEKQGETQKRNAALSQIDFEQLKIENDKLQDKVATRNQEMLRIKLSAGNCMRLLNEFKADLFQIVESKKKFDQEVADKNTLIVDLKAKIQKTQQEVDCEQRNLQALRQKEIGASDGPQSIDYLSLKVTKNTLDSAKREIERKIEIKKREIENMKFQ